MKRPITHVLSRYSDNEEENNAEIKDIKLFVSLSLQWVGLIKSGEGGSALDLSFISLINVAWDCG